MSAYDRQLMLEAIARNVFVQAVGSLSDIEVLDIGNYWANLRDPSNGLTNVEQDRLISLVRSIEFDITFH